jgi:hypothetical protein
VWASALHARLPAFGVGTGLGQLGLLPPAAEPTLLWVAALVELNRLDEVVPILDALEGALAEAVTAQLSFGDRAQLEPLRAALERARARTRTA